MIDVQEFHAKLGALQTWINKRIDANIYPLLTIPELVKLMEGAPLIIGNRTDFINAPKPPLFFLSFDFYFKISSSPALICKYYGNII